MKRTFTILLFLYACMLSACSHQDKANEILFKGESEHWKVTYTCDSHQKMKKQDGQSIEAIGDLLHVTYKGDKKDLNAVRRYKVAIQGAEENTLLEKKMDQTFKETGEVYMALTTSTDFTKETPVTVWILLDGQREPVDLTSE
ncbi:hypothetical protein JQN58_19280 [Aneurinibacillus sp. BA2021]|nr:hypothetical protein [Aneurinibacillus sp. BA2021]